MSGSKTTYYLRLVAHLCEGLPIRTRRRQIMMKPGQMLTRRDPYARLERRVRDRVKTGARDVLRSRRERMQRRKRRQKKGTMDDPARKEKERRKKKRKKRRRS